MIIRSRKSSELTEAQVTDEKIYRNRRQLLQQMGFVGMGGLLASSAEASFFGLFDDDEKKEESKVDNTLNELNYKKAPPFDEELTSKSKITSYNNFYEFGLSKDAPKKNSQDFQVNPWELKVTGLVDKEITLGYEDLFKLQLEERIYRMRCVEAWSMVIPWVGFPLAALLKKAGVKSSANYVAFETLYDPDQMPGQASRLFGGGIKYPYVEGLRLDEAAHPLTIMAVGVYGQSLPNQNGAPVRLVVPWKYGFKSIKSVVNIRLVDREPPTTWNLAAPHEYGFYANVNPKVNHPRWSQAKERRITSGGLGADERIATQMFNGYQEEVAELYAGMDLRKFY